MVLKTFGTWWKGSGIRIALTMVDTLSFDNDIIPS